MLCSCSEWIRNTRNTEKQRIELKPRKPEELIKRKIEKKVLETLKKKWKNNRESKSESEEKRTNAEKSETKEANQS